MTTVNEAVQKAGQALDQAKTAVGNIDIERTLGVVFPIVVFVALVSFLWAVVIGPLFQEGALNIRQQFREWNEDRKRGRPNAKAGRKSEPGS
jgi:hypothetical protein